MKGSWQSQAKQLAQMAGYARTIEDLSGLILLMMKLTLKRMPSSVMDVHLGGRETPSLKENSVDQVPADGDRKFPPAEASWGLPAAEIDTRERRSVAR